jgi:FkbM family methyltransferase
MIPKVILQTSKLPYPEYVKNLWQSRIDESWTIAWFNDEMIYQFFKDNPLPEFPNIIDVFNSFTDGGHKADLFRYYYLYLNGGFFIDSDIMTEVHMNEIYSHSHDHIMVVADVPCNRFYHPEINSPIIFNGLMGCIPRSQIIYEALTNAYNVKTRLLEKQRLYFVYILYVITERLKQQYNILFFNENMDGYDAPYSYTEDANGQKIAVHYFTNKIIPTSGSYLSHGNNLTFFTTFNLDGYNLYGRAWIKTFIGLLSKNLNIRATIYCEGFTPDIHHNSIEYVDFAQSIPEHKRWKIDYLKHTKHMKYTRDMTIRFSHKAFVIQHMLTNASSEYVVWLDGDCVFKDAEYSTFARSLVGDKLLACQVEAVKDTTISHVESGFLLFNTGHPDKSNFVETFKKFYSREHIIKMPNDNCDTKGTGNWQDYGPYDGFIVHKTLMATGIGFINLNSTQPVDSPVANPESTFYHPELSSRFIHNIGHDGKLEYMTVNSQLDIDKNFEWSHHATNELSNLDRININIPETVVANYRGEFPFTIHSPTCDLVISGDIFLNKTWEPHISDIIVNGMKPNGIFVDIGANIGWHSKVVQNAGYNVIAFEPLAMNFELLKQNCEKDNSHLYQLGLSNEASTSNMRIDPANYGNSWIDNAGSDSIKVVKLDDVINSEIAQQVDVVKIDVQGFETRVIQGGSNFFNALRSGTTIVIEVSVHRPEFEVRVLIKELVAKSSGSYALCFWHNYEPVPLATALDDVARGGGPDWADREWLEFDLVIIK